MEEIIKDTIDSYVGMWRYLNQEERNEVEAYYYDLKCDLQNPRREMFAKHSKFFSACEKMMGKAEGRGYDRKKWEFKAFSDEILEPTPDELMPRWREPKLMPEGVKCHDCRDSGIVENGYKFTLCSYCPDKKMTSEDFELEYKSRYEAAAGLELVKQRIESEKAKESAERERDLMRAEELYRKRQEEWERHNGQAKVIKDSSKMQKVRGMNPIGLPSINTLIVTSLLILGAILFVTRTLRKSY
jgi:hypothetical protein